MPDPADSDELLLQAIGRGDLASFARIVERHQAWAWRVTWRLMENEEDTSDIVQEADGFRKGHVAALFSIADDLI